MTVREVDVLVIGAGPAGLAAAAVVAGGGYTCLIVDRMGPGGELMNLGRLTGVDDLAPDATGPDLIGALADAVMTAGAEIGIDEVVRLARNGDQWVAELGEGPVAATQVVVATGRTPGTTGLPEEAGLEGRGLSHCAHCDAPLYAGRPVAVAGADAWAIAEVLELAGHASEVTLVSEGPIALEPHQVEAMGAGRVRVVEGRIVALETGDALAAVVVEAAGKRQRIEAQGLFLQTGRRPALDFLDPASRVDDGSLQIAGDAVAGSPRTIAEAIAAGRQAGHNAVAWMAQRA